MVTADSKNYHTFEDEMGTSNQNNHPSGDEEVPDAREPQNEDSPDEEQEHQSNNTKKIIVGMILGILIILIILDSLTTGYIQTGTNNFLEWIENNPELGLFIFMLGYFIATVLFVPGSILTLGAGFVFAAAFGLGPGVLLGTIAVFVGASGGAIAAFLLGRFLFRDWVKTLTKKYAIFEALDVALEEKGLRIMILLRLSPIIPFNAINYIAGVTAISFQAYASAMVAILPGTILYVFLGASAGSLADSASSGSSVTLIVVVVGIVFGIAAVGVTSYYAKKELNRIIEERQRDDSATQDEEIQYVLLPPKQSQVP